MTTIVQGNKIDRHLPLEKKGWIGVDLDGTLAEYHEWKGAGHIGAPIMPMINRIREWLAKGINVRIFTARVCPQQRDEHVIIELAAINAFCMEHFGIVLPVTCIKDYSMIEFWDDRAVSVMFNQGHPHEGTAESERRLGDFNQ